MSDDPRIEELLERWEELAEAGQDPSPEDLCGDCPELLDEVRDRIRRLQWVNGLLDTTGTIDAGTDGTQLKTLGRYRLDELLGEGGFGQVWKGFDPELQRVVAIKVLRPERRGSIVQIARFLDEAKKIAQLRHASIVAVHDVGREADLCYIVEDLIDGTDLAQRMSDSTVDIDHAVDLVATVADALDYAHENGIVHRDVKPTNILLDRDDKPYLTDFGIAVTERELAETESGMSGTPAYMAPEQASTAGAVIDRRTDVYSLGVVLYELLSGTVPYEARTLAVLKQQVDTSAPPSPRSLNPSISRGLNRICMKALATAPANRWTTAKEFADALRTLAAAPRIKLWLAIWSVVMATLLLLMAVLFTPLFDGPLRSDSARYRDPSVSADRGKTTQTERTRNDEVAYPTLRQRLMVNAKSYLTEFDRGLSPLANTGIAVGKGETIEVTAWGTWECGTERGKQSGAEWLFAAIGQVRQPPVEHHRAGDFLRFRAKESGTLFLGTSDLTADDNNGFLTAEIVAYAEAEMPDDGQPSNGKCLARVRPLPVETRLLGRDVLGSVVERDESSHGSVLVGLNITTGILRGFRLHTVLESVQPVYVKEGQLVEGRVFGDRTGEVTQLRAKAGYAIGALQVNHSVESLRARHMRITPQGLDTQDAYWGDWIGGEPYEFAPVVCGYGRSIVGLTTVAVKQLGTPHRYVKAIGLVTAQDESTTDTFVAGRLHNLPGFRDRVDGDGQLAGLRLSLGKYDSRRSAAITSIQPIYLRKDQTVLGRAYGQATGVVSELRARKGFAVGAIKVASGNQVVGLQLVYMRMEQQNLDPADAYADDWYGRIGPGTPSMLGGDGRPVVGLTGIADKGIHALGLIQRGTPQTFTLKLENKNPASKAGSMGPVLHMTFDEGTVTNRHGHLFVDDLSGAGNHGMGEHVEIVRDGVRGNALALNGGRLELPRMLLNRRREYTISFWIFREAAGKIGYSEFAEHGDILYSFGHSTSLNAWNRFAKPDSWKGGRASEESTPVGKWFFLAAAFKAEREHEGTARVMVDDRLFFLPTQSVDNSFPGFGAVEGTDAKIDEMMVFDRALSDSELRDLYERRNMKAGGRSM